MNFVVIGGDAAGMSAASRAKRNQPDMDVIVLEQTADVSYSACGMPYNIAEPDREMDDLVVRHAHVFREKQGIDLRTGHCAQTIDPDAKTVSGQTSGGDGFQLAYDKLLIATGASPIIPHLPGFDLDGVLGLKSLEDGRKLKQFIVDHRVKKAVIIGMGYIALEMCEALCSRGIAVDMVKPRPVFLPWMNETLSAMVREEVERHGVSMYPGHEVTGIEKSDHGLKVVCSDLKLDAQMVIVAIGVTPNSEIAEKAGIELGPEKEIAVDRTLLTSDKNIYSAGDCADAYHVVTGKKTWIPLALRAWPAQPCSRCLISRWPAPAWAWMRPRRLALIRPRWPSRPGHAHTRIRDLPPWASRWSVINDPASSLGSRWWGGKALLTGSMPRLWLSMQK